MVSQDDEGELILGDSHEYDYAIEPFDKAANDDMILRELRRVIRLADWEIAERWHGFYAKHPTRPTFDAEPMPGVHVRKLESSRGAAGSRTSITCSTPRPPKGSSETSMIPEPTSTSSFCAFGSSSRPTRTGARGSPMS